MLIDPRGLYRHACPGLYRHGHRGPGHPVCPSVFPAPTSSSSSSRLRGLSVGVRATVADGNRAAALASRRGLSAAPRGSTALYSRGICTTLPDTDATSSLDKTALLHRRPGPRRRMFPGITTTAGGAANLMAGRLIPTCTFTPALLWLTATVMADSSAPHPNKHNFFSLRAIALSSHFVVLLISSTWRRQAACFRVDILCISPADPAFPGGD